MRCCRQATSNLIKPRKTLSIGPQTSAIMSATTITSKRFYSNNNSDTTLPSKEDKPEFVQGVFKNVAPKYDLMNDLMSLYIHRLWKTYFIYKLSPLPGTKLLDVAGGTGDIAMKFLEASDKDSSATVCDINEHMIEAGRKRFPNHNRLDWVVGDALELPFDDEQFDAYTIAFGIRNVADIDQALSEAYKVLKPGGIFMCLEFSDFKIPFLRKAYERYLLEVLPVMGEVVVGDYKSYRYLSESILNFPDQEDFKQMIVDAGFKHVTYDNLLQGVACIHSAYKPDK